MASAIQCLGIEPRRLVFTLRADLIIYQQRLWRTSPTADPECAATYNRVKAVAADARHLRASGYASSSDLRLDVISKLSWAIIHQPMGSVARTPGEEGLQDHVLMEAIYESARIGAPTKLNAPDKLDAFRGPPLPDEA